MANNGDLEQELKIIKQRLQVLEDKEAIRELLARYCFRADMHRTDAFLDLWTEDSTFDVVSEWGGPRKGKEQIRHLLDAQPQQVAINNQCQHLLLDLLIDVDGDTATATGYCVLNVRWQGGFGMFRCSVRTFRFRRENGRWLVHETVSRLIGDPECEKLIAPDV
ncbi:MAG: nuclear transport factor 2 family protein [Chloroflexi bacterium]|nr:nuclear transport factor 2 family protein [Chloroflexota bacterium]